MKFVIITHVPHIIEQNQFFAYAPYVREMNIWGKYVDELIIVAPKTDRFKTAIDCAYEHQNIKFVAIDGFDVLGWSSTLKTVFKFPKISWQIYNAMNKAEHIHLRCPGNIGLLGCVLQIAFPSKPKTAKYAGNWDPKSTQPWSYRLQKWILSNTFLTRNMQVLVYGEWPEKTNNVKSFFTATYSEDDKLAIVNRNVKGVIRFVFVGALVAGKNPLYAIQLVERIIQKGYEVSLTFYGDGVERNKLEQYCTANKLENRIVLKGNQTTEIVQKAYQDSHFVVLPSVSEGWPKVIAEGMFWGCVPIATKVSCVPYMLNNGNRGILLNMDFEKDISQIEGLIQNEKDFKNKSVEASNWSRKYTVELFQQQIKIIMKNESSFKN
ncbi:glycosyltransferase family 4 protein [Flavobacterium hiemivividum]|uniref:Glycosyltransferase n=1 Tax=Flavobacterium hiemivividum TaxID=2541734 RepID=A0A4R5D2T8_9FLAO|nr:glycosyltransferase [Flavobacterium hiemivividum]TDE04595.1 glycosyltransferase [Flavobacterium hiemivividum]